MEGLSRGILYWTQKREDIMAHEGDIMTMRKEVNTGECKIKRERKWKR